MCQYMLYADIWFQHVHVPFLITRFLSTVKVLYWFFFFKLWKWRRKSILYMGKVSELCRLHGWSWSALQLMMILASFLWRWSSMSLFSSILHVGIETEATVDRDNFEQWKHGDNVITLMSWPYFEQGDGPDDLQRALPTEIFTWFLFPTTLPFLRVVSCSGGDMSPSQETFSLSCSRAAPNISKKIGPFC